MVLQDWMVDLFHSASLLALKTKTRHSFKNQYFRAHFNSVKMMTYYFLIDFSLARYAFDLSSCPSFLCCSAQHSGLRRRAMACESMRAATTIVVVVRLYVALITRSLLCCTALRRRESILSIFADLGIDIHVAKVVRVRRALRLQVADVSWST